MVHTNYDEYAILVTRKNSSFGLSTTAALYGTHGLPCKGLGLRKDAQPKMPALQRLEFTAACSVMRSTFHQTPLGLSSVT